MPKSQAPRKPARSVPQQKKKSNQILDDLMTIDQECENMLRETAKFSPYLTDRNLVSAGQTEKIQDNAQILARDVIDLKKELDEIRVAIPKRIHTDNPTHVMKGLQVGEQYNAWQEKYTHAVLPTISRLADLFKDAAEVLGKNVDIETAEIVEEVKNHDNT